MEKYGEKKIIVFASDRHAGQLNPLLEIARAYWNSCDQQQTEIHFISSDSVKEKILSAIPEARFVSSGIDCSAGAVVQEPGYYEKTLMRPPFSIAAVLNLVELVLNADAYEALHNALTSYLNALPLKPVLCIVDGIEVAANDAFRVAGIPRLVNFPFNARGAMEDSFTGFWTFPGLGTGLSDQMTLWQKICNRTFTICTNFSLILTGIRFLSKRVQMSKISWKEAAQDTLAVAGAGHYFVNTVFGFEYKYELPNNATMIGACINEKDVEAQLKQNLKNKEPTLTWIQQRKTVIYIGLGTITKPSKTYVLNLLKGFQRVRIEQPDVSLLFKIPDGCYRPDSNDTILKDVRIVNAVHSQLQVLCHSHVKVFVSHCGGNGVHEGIYFGKAILGIPQWLDCYDFAQRVEDTGVGLRIHKTIPVVSVDEFSAKLLMLVSDDKYHVASKQLGATMREAGGIDKAVQVIKEHLHQ